MENLRLCFSDLFKEISNINELEFDGNKIAVSWFLVGDLKFISASIGHIGQAATFCCPFCEISKTELAKLEKGQPRTIKKITEMALERAGSDKAAPHLNRVYKGISQPPITNIPIEQIVPAPLHLILGLTKNVIDRIEAECEKYGTHHEFESTLRELGVSRDPHTKGFTGNNVKKMLSENARLLFKECMRGHNDFRERADELLSHMGAIQQIGMKAEFLTAEEIQKLRIASEEFVLLYNDTFEDSTITPKAHILLHHLPDFSQRFGFLGLLSEQGIEALHHRFNMAEKRFMCIKEEEMRWRRILAENSMRNALFDRTLESDVAEEFIRSESE